MTSQSPRASSFLLRLCSFTKREEERLLKNKKIKSDFLKRGELFSLVSRARWGPAESCCCCCASPGLRDSSAGHLSQFIGDTQAAARRRRTRRVQPRWTGYTTTSPEVKSAHCAVTLLVLKPPNSRGKSLRNKRQKMLKCLRGCGEMMFKGCVTPPTSPAPSAGLNGTI